MVALEYGHIGHGSTRGMRTWVLSGKHLGWFGLLAAVVIALAGCGPSPAGETTQFGGMRIDVVPPGDDTSDAAIQAGPGRMLSLRGQSTAHVEAAWLLGGHRLVLIAGSGKDCPRIETLLIARGETAQLRPLGKCRERFATSLSGDQWTARQINARDPTIWSFRDGTLNGPTYQSAFSARRIPGTETNPASDPTQPPAVSRPVGDDVVPAPVGAGPLPGRPPPPRLF